MSQDFRDVWVAINELKADVAENKLGLKVHETECAGRYRILESKLDLSTKKLSNLNWIVIVAVAMLVLLELGKLTVPNALSLLGYIVK